MWLDGLCPCDHHCDHQLCTSRGCKKEWSADRQIVIAQLAVSNITTKQELMRTEILSTQREKSGTKKDLIKEEQQEERYNWIGKLK